MVQIGRYQYLFELHTCNTTPLTIQEMLDTDDCSFVAVRTSKVVHLRPPLSEDPRVARALQVLSVMLVFVRTQFGSHCK